MWHGIYSERERVRGREGGRERGRERVRLSGGREGWQPRPVLPRRQAGSPGQIP